MRLFVVGALLPALTLPVDSAKAQATEQLKARCSQLIAYYDRYGLGRSTNSDGRRNHTRIAAEFDCKQGLYPSG